VLAGKDVLAVIPTSAGKSAIYQIPAIMRPGLVIVVSPLIALMIDQVDALCRKGVKAGALHSMCSEMQVRRTMDQVRSGDLKILYMSPERMLHMDRKSIGACKIQLLAVDEGHCVSEWGYDFRPAYLRLGKTMWRFNPDQVVALTATATKQVASDIVQVLQLREGHVRLRYSPDRPNISYMVVGRSVSEQRLVERTGTPCLIYGGTREGVEVSARDLSRSGFSCDAYHAGVPKAKRREIQERFLAGGLEVITATNAFGMGIDHSNLRGVIHLEMPSSIEAYTQEAGRAGRDGSPALALCRATVDTLEISKSMVPLTWPDPDDILRFWERVQRVFDISSPRFGPEGRIEATVEELASSMHENPHLVSSYLRILADSGAIARTMYQDRPVEIRLLRGAEAVRGSRQVRVMRELWEHANPAGVVVAPVRFMLDEIGLTKVIAEQLRVAGVLSFTWAERCQVIERLTDGDPGIDRAKVIAIAERAMQRIEAAREYLYTPGCRRKYLLNYFGDTSGGRSTGICCDRCHQKTTALPQSSSRDHGDSQQTPKILRISDAEVSSWVDYVAKPYLENRGGSPSQDTLVALSAWCGDQGLERRRLLAQVQRLMDLPSWPSWEPRHFHELSTYSADPTVLWMVCVLLLCVERSVLGLSASTDVRTDALCLGWLRGAFPVDRQHPLGVPSMKEAGTVDQVGDAAVMAAECAQSASLEGGMDASREAQLVISVVKVLGLTHSVV
jgi:ATP-dependent DNA helicase RecQ